MTKPKPKRTDLTLRPSPRRAMRIRGLVEALESASGVPAPKRQRGAWFPLACAAAAAPAIPDGTRVLFGAVREARKTVAHRLTDPADAALVARAFLDQTALPATIVGPVFPRIAKTEGFYPPSRPPRYSKDDAENARLTAMLRALVSAWRCHHYRSSGGAWTTALVTPVLALSCGGPVDSASRVIRVLVVIDAEARDVRLLEAAPNASLATEEDIRRLVDAAVAANRPCQHKTCDPAFSENIARAARIVGIDPLPFLFLWPSAGPTGDSFGDAFADDVDVFAPNPVEEADVFALHPVKEPDDPLCRLKPFEKAAQEQSRPSGPKRPPLHYPAIASIERAKRACLAAFRRSLPAEIQAHSLRRGGRRMWLHSFVGDPQIIGRGHDFVTDVGAYDFLSAHARLDLVGHGRMAQAFRVMPLLSQFARNPEFPSDLAAQDAIRDGRPIADVLGDAIGFREPVHRKTVASLLGQLWGIPARGVRHPENDAMRCVALAANRVFAANPHAKLLGTKDLEAMLRFATGLKGRSSRRQISHDDVELVSRLALAGAGVVSLVNDDCKKLGEIIDVIAWTVEACELAIGYDAPFAEDANPDGVVAGRLMVSAARAVADIVLPPGRTLKRLLKISADWHGLIGRHQANREALVAALGNLQDARNSGPSGAFPHFLDGPFLHEGVVMTPLTDADDIFTEGVEMGHCVGTYASGAMSGRCLLVSLRDAEGRRSTAELTLSCDKIYGLNLSIRQVKAPGNDPAPESHHKALREAVRANSTPGSLERLNEAVRVATIRFGNRSKESLLAPAERLTLARFEFDRITARVFETPLVRRGFDGWLAAYRSGEEGERAA